MLNLNILLNKYLIKFGIIESFYTIGRRDFHQTYLRSKKLEVLRRRINLYLTHKKIKKLCANELDIFYKDLFINSKDIVIKFINEDKLYAGFTMPDVLYFLIRKFKPKVVVETGVSYGISSAFILQALEDNGFGTLISIDLPLPEYYIEENKIGSFVPASLKRNWKLILGDARKLLPKLLDELKEIDVFFHDSDHSYEHMMFEFKTSWKYIKKGGVLMSDDINANDSFFDFARVVKRKPIVISAKLGIIIK